MCAGVLAVAEVLAAGALTVVVDWSWQQAFDAFVVTNAVMGASFAVSGTLVAVHRPRNILGWLLLADGLGHATSAWLTPLAQLVRDDGGPVALQRAAVTLSALAWPWSIAVFLPIALMVFPDGRLPGPRWRPVAWLIVLTGPLFVIEAASDPSPLMPGLPLGFLTMKSYDSLALLWTLSELRTMAALVAALSALVVRYRTAGEADRRRILWLLLAALAVVLVVGPWAFVAGTPVVVLFAIPLVPAAVCVAVLRYQLLDIRIVVSRTLTWLLLSLTVLGVYVVIVAVFDAFISRTLGRSVVATVLLVVVAAPLLPRLQRVVDRWMYGDRSNPGRVASGVAERLAAAEAADLSGVVAALRASLRLPYVALITRRGEQAADGEPPDLRATVDLTVGGRSLGVLEAGLRAGERELSTSDRAALQLVASPLALSVRALELSADLAVSRERIVVAREEERRRLRRDLHDGLGPTLTGMSLAADAAGNLVVDDPDVARELVGSLRRDSRSALAEVRRLVDDLQPTALDELGLVAALRQRAAQLARRPDGSAVDVHLRVPSELPNLPAAVELAAYRIATEALTNVARHAQASSALLTLRCDRELEVEVVDDGRTDGWVPGVGLQAMAERAAEVGARFEAGPSGDGGRVYVAIPLEFA